MSHVTTLTQRRTSEPPPGRTTLPAQDTKSTGNNSGPGTEQQQQAVWKLQGGSIIVSSTPDENRRRLRALMSRVKWATKESETLAEAFNAFEGIVADCRVLCEAVVDFEVEKRGGSRSVSGAAVVVVEGGREVQFSDWVAKALERSPGLMEVRDWRETLVRLMTRYREEGLGLEEPEADVSDMDSEVSFASSNSVQPNPSPREQLKTEYRAIQEACSYIHKLLTFRDEEAPNDVAPQELSRQSTGKRSDENSEEASSTPLAGACGTAATDGAAVFRRLERPSNQAAVKSEKPITTQRYDISTRGDTILEFPIAPDDSSNATSSSNTRRRKASFRVSSHILSEVSPVFAQLFSKVPLGGRKRDEDFQGPYPRAKGHVCKDGLQIKVYRMPPISALEVSPLEILMHAAHMHNEQVPRTIDFQRFVTIAELCFRLQCTSPLEVVVEMRWLPDWVHMGGEAMPDGLLLISYVFGSRGLFTRMTKSAILNIVNEEELEGKRWPKELKEKIWAVRNAKMEQVYACCVSTVQEYLRPPTLPMISEPPSNDPLHRASIFDVPASSSTPTSSPGSWGPSPSQGGSAAPQFRPFRPFLSSSPRCPKGSHECDGSNLGYLMIVMSELQLLPIIMNPAALAHMSDPRSKQGPTLPRRSLAELVRIMQNIPSPPNPVHKGVCDPIPAFRAAVIDIYNSLSGLTLFDVTGKHGYVLSREYATEPQKGLLPVSVAETPQRSGGSESRNVPESVVLGILRHLSVVRDISAVAMANKTFYATYKKHEAALLDHLDNNKAENRAANKAANKDVALGPSRPLEDILTEEEARRIIWPDPPLPEPVRDVELSDIKGKSPIVVLAPSNGRAPLPEGSREKFRAEDALFTEEKMLCVMDTKQLTIEHDNYVGMYKQQKMDGEVQVQVWI